MGGGVSGLAAARRLFLLGQEHGREVELTLLEAGPALGGRVTAKAFAGVNLDLGAESLLARSEETWELLSALGIAGQALAPGTTSASIWNGRRLVAIPPGSALGVPSRPWSIPVLRAIGIGGAARASLEPWLGHQRPDPDSALGPFIRQRVGPAVLGHLVDPLVGGVYAGSAAQLSLGAVAPQLLQALERSPSLLRGLRQMPLSNPSRSDSSRPTFVTFPDGLRTLVGALQDTLPAAAIRLQAKVEELLAAPGGGGGRLVVAGAATLDCDGVVLALPAPQAASLVAGIAPGLADTLRQQEWASVATVSLAYPERALPRPLVGSGFLVPRSRRRVVTACTFLDRKWPHLKRPGQVLLRASVGSAGDDSIVTMDDTTVVSMVHNQLRTMLGLTQFPEAALVQRWQPALPQYRAGHMAWRARAAELTARLPVPVVLAGASYQGVGIASCMQSAAASASVLFDRVCAQGPAAGHDGHVSP